MTADTIFAVSTGAPPAAIGVIRVSGPAAGAALKALTGREFSPRRASLAWLYDHGGELLDEALVLWFPGPRTATGEDLVELHCHGGRAVLAAVEGALRALPGLRKALPGEFTRRAFANGRLDLAEAEGLADLLEAETELQRAVAIENASGVRTQQFTGWRTRVLELSALVEAALDFSDEDDVDELPPIFAQMLAVLRSEIEEWLDRPRSESLGQGFRVVLAGPPNAGKSTLFNALIESEAAITSPIAGTTRDVIERSVSIEGVPFCFVDTAGLRGVHEEPEDAVEAEGIARARSQLTGADVVLWLGEEFAGPEGAWEIAAKADHSDFAAKQGNHWNLSAITGDGVEDLKRALVDFARDKLPKPGEAALNSRQQERLTEASLALAGADQQRDLLLIGEELRRARLAFDQLIGRSTTEDMLDALFGRFCIGK